MDNMARFKFEQAYVDREIAYFRAQLAADDPESYSMDEKLEILRDIERADRMAKATMRDYFHALNSDQQEYLLTQLNSSDKWSPDHWKEMLEV